MLIYRGDDPNHFLRPVFAPYRCQSAVYRPPAWLWRVSWSLLAALAFGGLWAVLRMIDRALWGMR